MAEVTWRLGLLTTASHHPNVKDGGIVSRRGADLAQLAKRPLQRRADYPVRRAMSSTKARPRAAMSSATRMSPGKSRTVGVGSAAGGAAGLGPDLAARRGGGVGDPLGEGRDAGGGAREAMV
ncbi:MAG: hypothetical protein RIT28_5054, partial [Pseudomonadota bacterium]